jgi:plastocyanin
MRVIRILAVLAIAATFGLASGCGDDDDEDTAATEATTEEAGAGRGGATGIGMTEYAFDPARATVLRGDMIIATNDGEMPHNYTIPDTRALRGGGELTTGNVDPGSSGRVRLNVSVRGGTQHLAPGKYEVICTIPDHAEKGMRGTLTVERGG